MKNQLLLLCIMLLSISSTLSGQSSGDEVFFGTVRNIPLPGVRVNNALLSDADGLIPRPDSITSIQYGRHYPGAVDVLDLILTQRHMLGIAKFEHPYQKIAADTDGKGSLNGGDLFIAKKAIYFDQPMLWSFIESDSLGIQSSHDKSYVGICHGDVSGNVRDTRRIEKKYKVILEDQILNKGETYEIPFTLGEGINFFGLEFHVEIDTHKVEYTLTIPDQEWKDFQWIQRKKGHLVGLGYEILPIAADTTSAIATLSLKALDNTTLNQALRGDASRTSIIIDEELKKQRVIFTIQNILYPNQVESSTLDPIVLGPNPTSGRISINGLESESFVLDVYNTVGENVMHQENTRDIDMSSFAPGLYFYTLRIGNAINKGKIMLVR